MSDLIEHRPTIVSSAFGLIAVGLAASVLADGDLLGGLLAGMAAIVFILAIGGPNRRVFNIGIVVLVLALVVGALTPTPLTSVLAATILAIIAWDQFETAFTLGDQVGGNQPTARVEVFNAGATTVVGATGGVIIYAVYLSIPTGWPLTAIIVMLIGALFVLLALEF